MTPRDRLRIGRSGGTLAAWTTRGSLARVATLVIFLLDRPVQGPVGSCRMYVTPARPSGTSFLGGGDRAQRERLWHGQGPQWAGRHGEQEQEPPARGR